MRIQSFMKLFLLLGIGVFTFTSCEDDGTGGGGTGTTAPSISFDAGSGGALTLNPTEEFSVSVTATKGSEELNALSVYEDGVLISADRLKFNGTDAAANPRLILGDDKSGFTYEVTIAAQAEANVTNTFSIEIKDTKQNARSVSVDVTTAGTPPTLTYNGPPSFPASPSSNVSVKLVGAKGSGKITKISVYEDGNLMDASRLELIGNVFSANPYDLPASLQDGFDGMLILKTSADSGEKAYKVEITDQYGGVASQEFKINVGTPVESIMGVLLNQAGPSGQGGLDLDTGNGAINSTSAEAEIKDNGIDTGQPNSSNWRQTISGANGAVLKRLIAGQDGVSETFTFGGVASKSDVASLFNVGKEVSSSAKLTGGEVFAVSRAGKFYLIEIAKVNTTTNDNADNYEINIKK